MLLVLKLMMLFVVMIVLLIIVNFGIMLFLVWIVIDEYLKGDLLGFLFLLE